MQKENDLHHYTLHIIITSGVKSSPEVYLSKSIVTEWQKLFEVEQKVGDVKSNQVEVKSTSNLKLLK